MALPRPDRKSGAERSTRIGNVAQDSGMTLSTRLMLAMVALVLMTAATVGVISYWSIEAIALPDALDRIAMHTRLLATELETSVAGARADVNTQGRAVQGLVRTILAGGRDPLGGTPEAEWRKALAGRFVADLTAKPAYARFGMVGIADGGRELVRVDRLGPDGSIRVVPDAELQNLADQHYFNTIIGLPPRGVYVALANVERPQNAADTPAVPTLWVAAPVFDADGKPFGFLSIGIDLRPAFARILAAPIEQGAIYIVNEQGNYLVDPARSGAPRVAAGELARIQDEFAVLAEALSAKAWPARITSDRAGRRSGIALATVPLAEGRYIGLVEAVPGAQIMEAAITARNASLLAGLAAVLGAIVVAVLLARSLTRPLAQITAAVNGFTGTGAIDVPTDASGEVGVLARSFARMVKEVQNATTALDKETLERQHLFDTSPDLILITDRRGIFVQVSPSASAILGYRPEEMVGLSSVEFLYPDDRDRTRQEMRLARQGRSLRNFECRYRRKDGSVATLAWSGVWSEPTQEYYFIGRDTSDQRLAQEKFALAVESSPSGIVMVDASGAIVLVNAETERMFGYQREELIGQPIESLVPLGLRAVHLRDRTAFVKRPQRRRMGVGRDLFGVRKDGSQFPVEVGLNPISTREGLLVLSSVVDISETKAAQQALVESAAMARGIVDTALDAFVQMDEAGTILEWNSQAALIFGWSREQAIGKTVADLILPEIHSVRREDARSDFLPTGGGAILGKRFEMEARRRDGRQIKVEVSVTTLRRGGSHVFNAFIRDLTERIAAEAQIRQAQKMEAVGQLTGGIAHDFNNILTVITGTIEVLAEAVADKPQAASIAKMIDEAAERGAALTQRLLAFASKQPLQPRNVDVNELILDTVKLLRPTLGGQIEIESMLEDAVWPSLVDPHQFSTSVLNLALNARDAMPDGGKLTLETGNVHLDESYASANSDVQPGAYVLVAVSDTGTGIPAAIRERVFEPFFTTKEVGKGTGLGLSMVYGFVKQSGGHIKIYSEEGQGTTIKLYLPPARDLDHVAEVTPIAPIEGGEETILVVEDDPLVRAFVIMQLKSLGYTILATGNGAEALNLIEQGADFDLLFTDVMMPGGMNGRQLAAEALKRRPSLKVLFTSGYTEDAMVHHGRLDPGVLLLAKPYRKSDLAQMIRAAIDG
jgi:PAS domain S-box-containing protein